MEAIGSRDRVAAHAEAGTQFATINGFSEQELLHRAALIIKEVDDFILLQLVAIIAALHAAKIERDKQQILPGCIGFAIGDQNFERITSSHAPLQIHIKKYGANDVINQGGRDIMTPCRFMNAGIEREACRICLQILIFFAGFFRVSGWHIACFNRPEGAIIAPPRGGNELLIKEQLNAHELFRCARFSGLQCQLQNAVSIQIGRAAVAGQCADNFGDLFGGCAGILQVLSGGGGIL